MKSLLIIFLYFPPFNVTDIQRVRMSSPFFEQKSCIAEVVRSQLNFYESMDTEEIISLTHKFEISIGHEIDFPYNCDICLTNKLFPYLQTDLPVFASNIQSQKEFL